jgi:hypothetical protein
MLDVVFDIRSDTAPFILGMMASTLAHPLFDRLCVGLASTFEGMVAENCTFGCVKGDADSIDCRLQ